MNAIQQVIDTVHRAALVRLSTEAPRRVRILRDIAMPALGSRLRVGDERLAVSLGDRPGLAGHVLVIVNDPALPQMLLPGEFAEIN